MLLQYLLFTLCKIDNFIPKFSPDFTKGYKLKSMDYIKRILFIFIILNYKIRAYNTKVMLESAVKDKSS